MQRFGAEVSKAERAVRIAACTGRLTAGRSTRGLDCAAALTGYGGGECGWERGGGTSCGACGAGGLGSTDGYAGGWAVRAGLLGTG